VQGITAVMDMVSILIITTPATLPTTAPVITEYDIALADNTIHVSLGASRRESE